MSAYNSSYKIFNEFIMKDLNTKVFYSWKNMDLIYWIFLGFVIYGVFFPLFYYLMKFTKTILRVSFLGLIQVIVIFIWFICKCIYNNFMNNYSDFLTLCSLIGIFTGQVLFNNQDEVIIDEYRKLMINENE